MHGSESSRKRKDSAPDSITLIQKSTEQRSRPPSKPPRRWAVWEDVRLIVAARRYSVSQWKQIAREVGNHRNHMQVLQRWKAVIEPAFAEIKWSETEDAFLRFTIDEALESGKVFTPIFWKQLAARLPFRSGPDVETRWFNHLADDEQKFDYTTTGKRKYEIASTFLKQDEAPSQSAVISQGDAEEDAMPTPPPPRQRVLGPPVVRQVEPPVSQVVPRLAPHIVPRVVQQVVPQQQVRDQQLNEGSTADSSFSLPVTDAFEYTSAPLSSTEVELYDFINDISDLPYSHQFESFVLAESKQTQRNSDESEHMKDREYDLRKQN